MVLGCPCMCIRHTGTSASAAAARAPGSSRALTSLMRWAPAAQPALITAALEVSREIITSSSCTIRSTTGMTLSSSSCSLTSGAPGRVDSPPMSMRVAPSSIIWRAWARASSSGLKRPPSEKESGVTLRIPMTWGRSRERLRPLLISCIFTSTCHKKIWVSA
ncbi:hypothetical protein D3C81_282280 [compost metagenome]